MNRIRMPIVLAICLLAGLSLDSPAARADLLPCKENATGDKIYLDDVRAKSDQEKLALAAFMQTVAFTVEGNLRAIETRTSNLTSVLTCVERYPTGDATFSPTLSSNLTTEKVLLEVWSGVYREAAEDGNPVIVVETRVAVLPLLAQHQPSAPSGVMRFKTRLASNTSSSKASRAIRAQDELWALARIAFGLRAYGLKDYAAALSPLCDGARSLRKLKSAARKQECAAWADFADQMAMQARERRKAQRNLPDFIEEAAQCADPQ